MRSPPCSMDFDAIRLVGGLDSRGIVSFVHTSLDLLEIERGSPPTVLNVWINTPVGTPRDDRATRSRRCGCLLITSPRTTTSPDCTLPSSGSDVSTVPPCLLVARVVRLHHVSLSVSPASRCGSTPISIARPRSLTWGSRRARSTPPTSRSSATCNYDQMLGADTIAANTGATIVGSYETSLVLRETTFPRPSCCRCPGARRSTVATMFAVRVFPSLHSCLFVKANPDSGRRVPRRSRSQPSRTSRSCRRSLRGAAVDGARSRAVPPGRPKVTAHASTAGSSITLIQTSDGSIFVNASSGCWDGILGGLKRFSTSPCSPRWMPDS